MLHQSSRSDSAQRLGRPYDQLLATASAPDAGVGVAGNEPPPGQRSAQAARSCERVRRVVAVHDPVATAVLRVVQGSIGLVEHVREQQRRRAHVPRDGTDADGDLAQQGQVRDAAAHAVEDLRGARRRDVDQEQHELLTAEAADHVVSSRLTPQHVRDGDQRPVAGQVAVGVVVGLEQVQVQDRDGPRQPVALRLLQLSLGIGLPRLAAQQPGLVVVARLRPQGRVQRRLLHQDEDRQEQDQGRRVRRPQQHRQHADGQHGHLRAVEGRVGQGRPQPPLVIRLAQPRHRPEQHGLDSEEHRHRERQGQHRPARQRGRREPRCDSRSGEPRQDDEGGRPDPLRRRWTDSPPPGVPVRRRHHDEHPRSREQDRRGQRPGGQRLVRTLFDVTASFEPPTDLDVDAGDRRSARRPATTTTRCGSPTGPTRRRTP